MVAGATRFEMRQELKAAAAGPCGRGAARQTGEPDTGADVGEQLVEPAIEGAVRRDEDAFRNKRAAHVPSHQSGQRRRGSQRKTSWSRMAAATSGTSLAMRGRLPARRAAEDLLADWPYRATL